MSEQRTNDPRNGFLGVYMTDDGPIRIDNDTSKEQLLFVIGRLIDEANYRRKQIRDMLEDYTWPTP